MKAEIILTDNNINIDLNEPTIDVSTEDGFSVTIIGGVGPQGNRGPKGEKGDDSLLTDRQGVNSVERCRHAPQEKRDQEYDRKKNTIFYIEFLLPSCFNCLFSHIEYCF